MVEFTIIIYFASTVFAAVFYALREDNLRRALMPIWNTIVSAWLIVLTVWCVIRYIWMELTD